MVELAASRTDIAPATLPHRELRATIPEQSVKLIQAPAGRAAVETVFFELVIGNEVNLAGRIAGQLGQPQGILV